jgi:hypothetical protein
MDSILPYDPSDELYVCLEHDWVGEMPCGECAPLDSTAPGILLSGILGRSEP